jgi:hypothetical protein
MAGTSRKSVIRLLNVLGGVSTGAAGAAVARFCRALGTAEKACWADATALCTLPAEVPVTWLTAAAWPASPPGLVLCCGGVNGVSAVADADEAA